ncbi:hypothetical protein BDQ12DRAFT_729875 [Crucibulum laeve]|uniref:Uncharacterized protein n=1 Tax=Crucibulum laeve TaxID=68775 RepID=A0A5C3LQV4_9AGAR|nr:hypothetical protein BDQ12DRAFT_729875 [Crucibulum laeve]
MPTNLSHIPTCVIPASAPLNQRELVRQAPSSPPAFSLDALSSTTTATDATIIPKARKRLPSTIPALVPPIQSPENDRPPSRPTAPKPSTAHKRLHNLESERKGSLEVEMKRSVNAAVIEASSNTLSNTNSIPATRTSTLKSTPSPGRRGNLVSQTDIHPKLRRHALIPLSRMHKNAFPGSSYASRSHNSYPSFGAPYDLRLAYWFPVSSPSLIAKYTSYIIPSSVRLSDPLNADARTGTSKPVVHAMGPLLDIALDTRRICGWRGRRGTRRGRGHGRGKLGHRTVRGNEKGKERQRDIVDKEKGKADADSLRAGRDKHDECGDVELVYEIFVHSPSPSSFSSMHSTRFGLLPGPPDGIHDKHLPEQAEVVIEVEEEEMPPKMRKQWIHTEAERLKSASRAVDTAAAGTGSRAVIQSKEQEMPLPPPVVVAVPSTSPLDSFVKLSIRSPAILTSGTRGVGCFAIAAAAMQSSMHSWSPFKRVQDVPTVEEGSLIKVSFEAFSTYDDEDITRLSSCTRGRVACLSTALVEAALVSWHITRLYGSKLALPSSQHLQQCRPILYFNLFL